MTNNLQLFQLDFLSWQFSAARIDGYIYFSLTGCHTRICTNSTHWFAVMFIIVSMCVHAIRYISYQTWKKIKRNKRQAQFRWKFSPKYSNHCWGYLGKYCLRRHNLCQRLADRNRVKCVSSKVHWIEYDYVCYEYYECVRKLSLLKMRAYSFRIAQLVYVFSISISNFGDSMKITPIPFTQTIEQQFCKYSFVCFEPAHGANMSNL